MRATNRIKFLLNRQHARTLAAVVSGLLISLQFSAYSDEAENEPGAELQSLREEISQLSKDLDRQVASRDREREELIRLEKLSIDLEQGLQATRDKLKEQGAMVEEIERKIAVETARQASQRENLAALVYATYIMGDRSYLKMLLNQENPYSLGRTINYYRYISMARDAELTKIRTDLSSLAKLGDEKEQEYLKLGKLESRYSEQILELEDTRSDRDRALAMLQQKIRSTEGRLEELEEDRKRLERLTGELARYSSRLPGSATISGDFDQQLGRLQLPVAGRLQQEFGHRIPGSGMSSNGVFIDTSEETGVHAIFEGQVIYADWLRGFGLLVIVDHGGGYMSLYGHNKLLYKQVGDVVETGESIALSGTTGGLASPGVYFEIRHNGKPRDPMQWCRL